MRWTGRSGLDCLCQKSALPLRHKRLTHTENNQKPAEPPGGSIALRPVALCLRFDIFLLFPAAQDVGIVSTCEIPMFVVYSSVMVSGILMIPYFGILIYNKIKEPDPNLAPKNSETGGDAT